MLQLVSSNHHAAQTEIDAAGALHRIIFAEPSAEKFSWSALHFKTNGQTTVQSGRKDRKRHGLHGSVNKSVVLVNLYFYVSPQS